MAIYLSILPFNSPQTVFTKEEQNGAKVYPIFLLNYCRVRKTSLPGKIMTDMGFIYDIGIFFTFILLIVSKCTL